MNDLFKNKLGLMSSDEILMSAIKTAFNEELSKSSPQIGENDDDALIGQKFRASEEARKIINNFYITLQTYKENKSLNNKLNKER